MFHAFYLSLRLLLQLIHVLRCERRRVGTKFLTDTLRFDGPNFMYRGIHAPQRGCTFGQHSVQGKHVEGEPLHCARSARYFYTRFPPKRPQTHPFQTNLGHPHYRS